LGLFFCLKTFLSKNIGLYNSIMEKGIVYKITCNVTNKFYIGSTSNKLNYRITQHKHNYKYYLSGKGKNYLSSFEVLKENNFTVDILEQFNYLYKAELMNKERIHILNNKSNVLCVNIVIPNNAYYRVPNKNVHLENILKVFEEHKYYNKTEFIEAFNSLSTIIIETLSSQRCLGILNSVMKNTSYFMKSKQVKIHGDRKRVYFLDKT